MLRKIKKGFTLVELVVVIAVVAILAAVSVVAYVSITNKAEQSADEQTVTALNGSISGDPEIETVHDALMRIKGDGSWLEEMTPKTKDAEFAFHLKEKKVVLLKDNEILYPVSLKGEIADNNKHEVWRFAKSDTNFNDKYSYYLGEAYGDAESITCAAGLDVGENSIGTINYVHTSSPSQEVVIRTKDGALDINGYRSDTPDSSGKYDGDTVHHYSYTTQLDVTNLGDHCYYEHGIVKAIGSLLNVTFVVTPTALFCQTEEIVAEIIANATGVSIEDYGREDQYAADDPLAPDVPEDAYYKLVDANGDEYYQNHGLEEAVTGLNNYTIVLLKDVSNPFQFIYNCTMTLDFNGFTMDLSHESDGFGCVKSQVTFIDSDPQQRGTLKTCALEVMYDARATIEGGTFLFSGGANPWGGQMADFGLGGPIVCNGGRFNVDPSGHLGAGHTCSQSAGIWTVI